MSKDHPFIATRELFLKPFFSCVTYRMEPNSIEGKHFHDGLEVVYIKKGNCKTHKQGHWYIYKRGEVHEVINDSNEELIMVVFTFPPENEKTMHFVE